MEELKQCLLYTTLELEQTKAAAQEELRKRDTQLASLKDLLSRAIRERDQARRQCQCQALLFQQQPPNSGISSIEEDDQPRNNSDCEESIVSSPPLTECSFVELAPLPEKGKLLEAVMKAGPLLQTLLLAGPLPQWRHPPPPLHSFQIPPVTIPSHPQLVTNTVDSESPIETKSSKF